ncbi:hypothetical protein KM043_011583 [Ampulex compressa]|nr:hypothetical protein KM043_011583 [Ampulex compressa]
MYKFGTETEKVERMRTSEPVAIAEVDAPQTIAGIYESLDRITRLDSLCQAYGHTSKALGSKFENGVRSDVSHVARSSRKIIMAVNYVIPRRSSRARTHAHSNLQYEELVYECRLDFLKSFSTVWKHEGEGYFRNYIKAVQYYWCLT